MEKGVEMMKNASFRFLWLGQSFANLGDVLYIVGLIAILYGVTESAFFLAMLPFLNTFGRFVSGMFAPVLLNRHPLKTLLVSSQLSKTLVLLGLSLYSSIHADPILWIVLVAIFIISLLDGWANPATHAMLPRLVEKHEIVKANSLISVITDTIQLGGWAVGGMLVALLNGQNVIWLTCALFILSTWMMMSIVDESSFVPSEAHVTTVDVLKSGWIGIWEHALYKGIHIQITLDAMANVVWVAAILYVYVFNVLHASEAWWGYINTAFFVGLLVGGIICSKFSMYIESNLRTMMILSSFAVSIVTFLFGFTTVGWLALLLAIANGLTQQVKGIAIDTYLQKEASVEELPNIYAAQSALVSLVFGLSSLVFGAIAEFIHVKVAFGIAGLLLAGGAVYIVCIKDRFPKGYDVTRR